MKKIGIRLTSFVLVMLLLASFVAPVSATATGAVTTSTVTTSVPATYSKEYNSGMRNVACTTLDGTSAESYYANYDYEDLSELSAAQLFSSLQTLMRTTHTYTSSYDDCHYKANQTDCTNGSGNVLLLYTSYSATMSQWNGWNREHVWPQSLGGGNTSGGGADLHHIRPSDAGVNSSRGNKKYGESGTNPSEKYGTSPAVGVLGGTYNNTYFEPVDEVKGDVARICLYVYVRWNSAWGADSITDVFQSIDVLLEWCELDPVDTWEMGRNEVVGSIQGNRNVFIDYPEYAWLLFGREVPEDMTTPSAGEAQTTPPTENPPAEDDSAQAILGVLNDLDLKMSLAYGYETSMETVTKLDVTTDTLNNALTGVSSTNSYSNWSGKTGASGAVYAGNSCGNYSSIQLRSKNSNSGIVSTASGGKIKSITVTWNSNTLADRTLDIYGKNTAYTSASELYNSSAQGTKIASLTHSKGSTQTATIEGDYAYIGIRSTNGAHYIESIQIEWASGSGGTESVEKVYKNSSFALRFGADKALADIEGVTSYGLKVSTGGKEDVYFSTNANSWKVDGAYCHVTVDLGDIINDFEKLSTKFTVTAYVEVDGKKHFSKNEKTYSVADMVKEYYGKLAITEVAPLYEYLLENGLV